MFEHGELCLLESGVCAGTTPLDAYDLVWMLGLGEREHFFDRCQILNNLPAQNFVNSPLGMLLLHSKHTLLPHAPITFSGNQPRELLAATRRHPEISRWVIKPTAGSYGRGVKLVDKQVALMAALESATSAGRYCIVQAYVEEIAAGETRSLWVNGQIIGSYLRIPDKDFLANLSQGGRARHTELDSQQTRQVLEIGNILSSNGVRFAAIDMAFPWLIEVNVANPGGLATLAGLEPDVGPRVGQKMAQALRTLLE